MPENNVPTEAPRFIDTRHLPLAWSTLLNIPFVLVLLAPMANSAAHADEVMILPERDNTLYEAPDGGTSNGQGEHLFVGMNSQSGIRRGLIYFPVAESVPAGAFIHDASLMLFMSQSGAGPKLIDLYRLEADWGEGPSDAPGAEGSGTEAADGDATWLFRFFPDLPWNSPGGDFSSMSSASTVVDAIGYYVWSAHPRMIADVQLWVDEPGANYGWIVVGDESEPGTAKRFESREHPDRQLHPVLSVRFSTPQSVPTISTWGVIILTLALATAAKLRLGPGQRPNATH